MKGSLSWDQLEETRDISTNSYVWTTYGFQFKQTEGVLWTECVCPLKFIC